MLEIFKIKALKCCSVLALFTAVLSTNTTCSWIMYHPEPLTNQRDKVN
ncbi:cyclic lactone autoinducer peptide [Metaclostridioides mangenotii]|uniref:Cyclic lactone autoinducer peptide n=1 Tax=Metaclostridioides mangenotii TaxID=1540 RepID=A0ABS4EBP6_9FIRM|nr:cyclic lactone autoinducer peptide [Clostridioides mangenotii]MBP1855321.1 cyclic lactone autoinducer peptide [Clostridioides mangenotii]